MRLGFRVFKEKERERERESESERERPLHKAMCRAFAHVSTRLFAHEGVLQHGNCHGISCALASFLLLAAVGGLLGGCWGAVASFHSQRKALKTPKPLPGP